MNFLDHFSPLVITLVFLVIVYSVFRYKSTLHYVALIAKANTIRGETELAKYLAKHAGGKLVQTKEAWIHFIPAAKELHRLHRVKSGELSADM